MYPTTYLAETPAPRAAAAPACRSSLVEALRSPACYPHAVDAVSVIETHISYVLLAGEHAYKIKKEVRLPFADFSSLEARRRFCAEEVRLNRRTAPALYLGVVPIAGPAAAPVVGGAGPAIEYAVHMRRFPADALLDALAREGRLTAAHAEALACSVAALHARAERAAPESGYGTPAGVLGDALDNIHDIQALEGTAPLADALESLREWTIAHHRGLAPFLAERHSDGFVRECHGDLHLANVVLVDGAPVPFDAIDFAPRLRWIDVMSEVAFTVMDLERHRAPSLAAVFLNRYLEETGDYAGLRVLRFYAVYRAMVRAKVAGIRACQPGIGAEARRAEEAQLAADVALAQRLARRSRPALILMHGLPGSGKSFVSRRLVESLGAVRIRSDVERKRRHGLGADDRSASPPGAGLYTERENDLTYGRLAELAAWSLGSGRPTVIDAAFLRRGERDAFRALASAAGASFAIARCGAPGALLRERVARREGAAGEASEAGLAVLALQERRIEPLARDEAAHAVDFDTARPGALRAACAALGRRIRPVHHGSPGR
jgi:aminoglycoside phosphotransferase family enzyme/predicted kinase